MKPTTTDGQETRGSSNPSLSLATFLPHTCLGCSLPLKAREDQDQTSLWGTAAGRSPARGTSLTRGGRMQRCPPHTSQTERASLSPARTAHVPAALASPRSRGRRGCKAWTIGISAITRATWPPHRTRQTAERGAPVPRWAAAPGKAWTEAASKGRVERPGLSG